MTLEDLVLRIRKRGGWNKTQVAKEFGLSRVTLYHRLREARKTKPLELSALALACRLGLIKEAVAFLLGQPGPAVAGNSTLMRAASLFPDLSPDELKVLRQLEETVRGTEPLAVDLVRGIIERLRAGVDHPPMAAVSSDEALSPSGEAGAGREACS